MDFENGVSFVDRLVGYQKRFEEHAARLFISESTGWGLRFYGTGWEREESSDSPPSSLISDSSQLEILIQELQRKLYIQYFIIPQKNTWDRFMISQIGFSKLLGPKQLYGPFLDLASSFGLKVDHNDEGLGGFRCRSESNSGKTASYQLCYNVRFVERHNRQNGNPWSFRHTAIYQQMNYKDRVFRSILLHPPNTVETAVKDLLSSMDARSLASHQDPLLVHILMCLITESGWRPFIADLEKEVADLNDKAIYSRVGKMAKSDFLTEFSDAQKMQSIRQRIIRAKAIIDTGIQTAAGLRSFFKAREHIEAGTVGGGLLSELDQYISRLENHQNSFGGLLQVVDGTMVLILDYRHDEGIQRTAIATQGILSAAQVDNDRMRDIARATQRDSQTMKVLTFIAILYLPGTLVASIFSSGIVNESDGNQTGTQRTRQIGLFGLTTVCLTVVTLIGAILWDKKESRSLRSARTTSP